MPLVRKNVCDHLSQGLGFLCYVPVDGLHLRQKAENLEGIDDINQTPHFRNFLRPVH